METNRRWLRVLEVLALLLLPAATLHNIMPAFGFSRAGFPFKLYEYAVLLLCIAYALYDSFVLGKRTVRQFISAVSVLTWIAVFTSSAALFNALVINGPVSIKPFNEAGGFLIAMLGISSLYSVIPDGRAFIRKLLVVFLMLCVLQFLYSLINARGYIIEMFSPGVTSAYYIAASWTFSSLYPNPNTYGFYMMAGVAAGSALAVSFCAESKLRQSVLASAGMLVCLFGTVMTASRASLFGCAVMIICIAAFSPARRAVVANFKIKPLYAWSVAAAGIGIIIFVLLKFLPALLGKFDNGTMYKAAFWSGLIEDPDKYGAIDIVTANRFSYWRGFLQAQFASFPSFDFFFGKGCSRPVNVVDPAYGMHNIYLELWGKYGIACAAGLIALLIAAVKMLVDRKDLFFIVCIPAAFIAHDFFEDKIFINSLHPQLLFLYFVILAPVAGGKERCGGITREERII